MSEWQPIETAPRDGSYLLVWRRTVIRGPRMRRAVFIGRWVKNEVDGGYWSVERPSKNAGAAQDIDLRGWMPLPETD